MPSGPRRYQLIFVLKRLPLRFFRLCNFPLPILREIVKCQPQVPLLLLMVLEQLNSVRAVSIQGAAAPVHIATVEKWLNSLERLLKIA